VLAELTEKNRERVDLEDLFKAFEYIESVNFFGEFDVKTAEIFLLEVAGGCFKRLVPSILMIFAFFKKTWEFSSIGTFDSSKLLRFVKLCLDVGKSEDCRCFILVIEGFDDIYRIFL
jgi:hypothetical protein